MAGVRVALAVEMEVPEGSEEAVKGVEMEGEARAGAARVGAREGAAREVARVGAREAAAREVAREAVEMEGALVGETVGGVTVGAMGAGKAAVEKEVEAMAPRSQANPYPRR